MDRELSSSIQDVTRVFVRANSAVELAGLEALVKSAPSLELAGSSLGRSQLDASSAAVEADVFLERPPVDGAAETQLGDSDDDSQARVWIVAENEVEFGLDAIREGVVSGLLPTWASASEIRTAVEAAAAGLVVLHPDIAERLTSSPASGGQSDTSVLPGQQLSPRETEILNLLAAGLGNKQIAGRLEISEHTVKFHVTSIFNKLGASSRAEAVAIGVRRGLIVL